MKSVNEEVVRHVAEVSRLKLSSKEIKGFVRDFQEVLDVFSQIREADTRYVEPSFQPIILKNVVRDDEAEKCLTQEQALSQTTNKKDGYFKGPKVV